MKRITTIQLESKEIRKALALFFGIEEKQVISTRFGFGLDGISEDEIKAKLGDDNAK